MKFVKGVHRVGVTGREKQIEYNYCQDRLFSRGYPTSPPAIIPIQCSNNWNSWYLMFCHGFACNTTSHIYIYLQFCSIASLHTIHPTTKSNQLESQKNTLENLLSSNLLKRKEELQQVIHNVLIERRMYRLISRLPQFGNGIRMKEEGLFITLELIHVSAGWY